MVRQTGGLFQFKDSRNHAELSEEETEKIEAAYKKARLRETGQYEIDAVEIRDSPKKTINQLMPAAFWLLVIISLLAALIIAFTLFMGAKKWGA